MKKKNKTVIIECEESKKSKKSGVSRYIVKKDSDEKIEKKKYSPVLKKYTIHKEK